jgi:hypothetical protein
VFIIAGISLFTFIKLLGCHTLLVNSEAPKPGQHDGIEVRTIIGQSQ